jgi:Uma2 family endonuclease
MPEIPDVPAFSLAPDWVGEVLSPSTALKDRARKMPVYAGEGVRNVWLIDRNAKTLEVVRLDADAWRLVTTRGGDERVRAEPFDAVELDLALLWAQ